MAHAPMPVDLIDLTSDDGQAAGRAGRTALPAVHTLLRVSAPTLSSGELRGPAPRSVADPILLDDAGAGSSQAHAAQPTAPPRIPPSDQIVCYGMLRLAVQGYNAKFQEDKLGPMDRFVDLIPVPNDRRKIGILLDKKTTIGHVDRASSPYLMDVVTLPKMQYQAWIPANPRMTLHNLSLHVILYGPYGTGRYVGVVLQTGGLFLEKPTKLKAGMEVHNPQVGLPPAPLPSGPRGPPRLPSAPASAPLNMAFRQTVTSGTGAQTEALQSQIEAIFANIVSAADLPEWPAPALITSQLYPHQQQALYWMMQREKYVNLDDAKYSGSSVYEDTTHAGGARIDRLWKRQGPGTYVNVLTGAVSPTRPELTRGGIVADDMGLGKTIQVLSLVLATHRSAVGAATPNTRETLEPKPEPKTERKFSLDTLYAPDETPDPGFPANRASKSEGTLIVCPLSTVSNWEEQVQSHVQSGTLRVHVFHGAQRQIKAAKLAEFDVVLTTYNTVAIEYKKVDTARRHLVESREPGIELSPAEQAQCRRRSVLHEILWRRVVLDEAHIIRNPKALMTRACCSLEAERRWCLTGTPLQNRLRDIFSLLCFLRMAPFDNAGMFRHFIEDPLAHRNMVGVVRLQTMMKAMTLRRVKSQKLKDGRPILELPPKRNEVRWLELDERERKLYDGAFQSAQTVFRSLCETGSALKRYAHLLALILRLRQLVTYPGLVRDYDKVIAELLGDEAVSGAAFDAASALRVYALMRELEETLCCSCNRDVELVSATPGDGSGRGGGAGNADADGAAVVQAYVAPCEHLYCMQCYQMRFDASNSVPCFLCDRPLVQGDLVKVSADADMDLSVSGLDAASGASSGAATPEMWTGSALGSTSTSFSALQPFGGGRRAAFERPHVSKPRDRVGKGPLKLQAKRRVSKRAPTAEDHSASSSSRSKRPRGAEMNGDRARDAETEESDAELGSSDSDDAKSAADSDYRASSDDDDGGTLAEMLGAAKKGKDSSDGDFQPEPVATRRRQDSAAARRTSAAGQPAPRTRSARSRLTFDFATQPPSTKMRALITDLRLVNLKNRKVWQRTQPGALDAFCRAPGEDDPLPDPAQFGFDAGDDVQDAPTKNEPGTSSDPLEETVPTKSVVFSQWTSMLDALEPLLQRYGIRFVRLDGRMLRPARTRTLIDFKKDPRVEVILVSLQAGGVGLNLTAASRIYILEPYWNPAVEQQAVDRVYRLGQRRPVIMVRYVVKRSIEEAILAIQQHKLELAAIALREHLSDMAVDLDEVDTSADAGPSSGKRSRRSRAQARDWSDLVPRGDQAAAREAERRRNRAERMLDLRTLFGMRPSSSSSSEAAGGPGSGSGRSGGPDGSVAGLLISGPGSL